MALESVFCSHLLSTLVLFYRVAGWLIGSEMDALSRRVNRLVLEKLQEQLDYGNPVLSLLVSAAH